MILATGFTFIVGKSWKTTYFHSKMAWPPATYDVISRNHSNWPSLNLSQNVREGWTSSYWKSQVLMFYPLIENSEKPYGGGGEGGWHPPPLYVRGLRDLLNVFMSIHPQTTLLIIFNCCILSFNLLAFIVPKKLEKKFVDLL